MSEEELIETLRAFEKNRVEQLEEPAKNLFYAIMEIADERDRLNNIIKGLDNTIENLEEVIKHKDSIIKEVREYIEKWLFEAGGNGACMNYDDIEDIREILKGSDKE